MLQPCLTLRNSMVCSLPGSSVHGNSPGQNTGVGCHFLLQGIFSTQGSNPQLLHLLHCRGILYPPQPPRLKSYPYLTSSSPYPAAPTSARTISLIICRLILILDSISQDPHLRHPLSLEVIILIHDVIYLIFRHVSLCNVLFHMVSQTLISSFILTLDFPSTGWSCNLFVSISSHF